MANIAFLGTGLMGSAFVELLLAHGDAVRVWNRTAAKAEALVVRGAVACASAAEAVAGAERVHCMFTDDAVVDEILAEIVPHVQPATPIIDHSTVLPARVAERALKLEAQSIPFLHAPVFSPPAAVREKKAVMLVAGREAAYELCKVSLEAMSGSIWWLGERYDAAAAYKLFGNLFMIFVLNGLGDLYALARSLQIDPVKAHELFAHFRPDATIDVRGKRMAEGDFTAQFSLAMARKDIGLMLESAKLGHVELSTLPHIANVFDRLIANGDGDLDVGAIAKA